MRLLFPSPTISASQFVRLVVVGMLLLLAVSWRLWVTIDRFPAIPWWSIAVRWSVFVDRLAAAGMVGALTAAGLWAAHERRARWALGVALGAFLILVIGNQHRLQPWAYHFAIVTIWIVLLGPHRAIGWVRWLHASVYFYSAINKFDHQFLTSTGPLFLRTLAEAFGGATLLSPSVMSYVVWMFPVGELLVAVTLIVPRTRPFGCVLATLLHGTLLLILGPSGLHQRWGVLTWNVVFLAQTWAYFGCVMLRANACDSNHVGRDPKPSTQPVPSASNATMRWSRSAAILLAMMVLFAPMLEPWGRWDHWLSWGLYSARAPRAELFVADAVVPHLPPGLSAYCGPLQSDRIWRHVAIDRWSLDQLQVPIYPQDRFHVGVARAILEQMPTSQRWIMVVRYGPPDRWTGRTSAERATGEHALLQWQREYWGNTRPRAASKSSIANGNGRAR